MRVSVSSSALRRDLSRLESMAEPGSIFVSTAVVRSADRGRGVATPPSDRPALLAGRGDVTEAQVANGAIGADKT